MFSRTLLVATTSLVVLGAACSSSTSSGTAVDNDAGTSGGSSNGGGIALADLPPKLSSALCTAYGNCFGPAFSLFLNGLDCPTLTEQRVLNGTFPRYQSEIDAGKLHYDSAQAKVCLDTLASLSCAELLDRDHPECLAAIDGTVELGQNCTLNEECKGNAICQSSSGTCPGQCVPLLAAGQACMVDDDCDSGLLCSPETKLCVQPATSGQACEYGAPPCSPGLLCMGKDDTNRTSGTCKTTDAVFSADVNATCDPTTGAMCKIGLSCVADSVTTGTSTINWKCVTAGTYAAGATCKPAFPDACESGYYCKTGSGAQALTGNCVILPAAQEPCAPLFAPRCRTGAVCINDVCQNYAANGVSCTDDAVCYSEYCATSGGCAARVPCL